MGLVNLRSAKLLLVSVTNSRLEELKSMSSRLGFKAISTADSVPTAIQALKGGKTDVLVVDAELGGTQISDFLKAVQHGFPKVKILPVLPPVPAGENAKGNNVHFPLEEKAFSKTIDQLVMAKMGIATSSVAVSDEF